MKKTKEENRKLRTRQSSVVTLSLFIYLFIIFISNRTLHTIFLSASFFLIIAIHY